VLFLIHLVGKPEVRRATLRYWVWNRRSRPYELNDLGLIVLGVSVIAFRPIGVAAP
jgi:hypothetical protein